MFGEVFHEKNIENIFNAFGVCYDIYKPVLTVNDLCISYRTINNWEANGLMLKGRKSTRDWHKFSFVDFIWLNIVFELRQLGFPLKKIKKLKSFLNETIKEESLFAIDRVEARVFLNNTSLTRLVLLLAEIMFNKNHIALLCNKDGDFYIYNEQMVKENRLSFDISQLTFSNFVSVSLTDIIIKYLINAKPELIEESKIIDSAFMEILVALRKKELTSLCFQLSEGEVVEVSPQLFAGYDEYVKAAVRLILTLKFQEVNY